MKRCYAIRDSNASVSLVIASAFVGQQFGRLVGTRSSSLRGEVKEKHSSKFSKNNLIQSNNLLFSLNIKLKLTNSSIGIYNLGHSVV